MVKGIAIAGNDEAGKSTVASYIKELYVNKNIKSSRVSFATAPKNDLQDLGIDMLSKPYSDSRRLLIRSYSETAKEQFGENYWAERLITSLNQYEYDHSEIFIVDDLRFHVELNTWQKEFTNNIIFVLTNNIPNYNYQSHESVIQVNDIIHKAKLGLVANAVCINNVHTTNGIHSSVKAQIEEQCFGIPIYKTT